MRHVVCYTVRKCAVVSESQTAILPPLTLHLAYSCVVWAWQDYDAFGTGNVSQQTATHKMAIDVVADAMSEQVCIFLPGPVSPPPLLILATF